MNDKRLWATALACAGLIAGSPAIAFASPSPVPQAQSGQSMITASGIVEDAEGPLIGATVMEKGNLQMLLQQTLKAASSLKFPRDPHWFSPMWVMPRKR